MKTRSICFILMLIFVLPPAYSQKKAYLKKRYKNNTGIKFDITAGADLQNFYGTDYWGEKLKNEFKPGFHAGADVVLPISMDLNLQAGLMFHNKGARQDTVAGNTIRTTNLYYVEVPVNILYMPQIGDGHILFGFGPYVAYGIFGNEKIKTGKETDNLAVKFRNDAKGEPTTYSYYRGLDAGADIFFGYELFSGFFFKADAQMGLLKINPDIGDFNDKTSKKNIGFGFSVGFRF